MATASITHNFDKVSAQISRILTQYIQRIERDADQVVFEQATLLRNGIVLGWPVDTGLSRASWVGPERIGYAHYRLSNSVPYAAVIEYGGYPGVGPKTSAEGGTTLPGGVDINAGIYPTQKPSAPVRRALSARIIELNAALEQVLRV